MAINSSNDLNSCTQIGTIYYWESSSPQHSPSTYCTVYNKKLANNMLEQVCIYNSRSTPKEWKRAMSSDGTWGDWCVNYDSSILTDSTILSPLASALGAIEPWGIIKGSVSTTYNFPKWTYGLLVLRQQGGNGCGLWFAATGLTEIANYLTNKVTVTIVDNAIRITPAADTTINYKLYTILA